MNELGIAQAIADGRLPSGTRFMGSAFYALRVSGTGAAWRESLGEYVYRSPRLWLAPEMQRRCCGVPLIWDHPPDGTLDGDALHRRIIGTLILGFVRSPELWGIARILDEDAAEALDLGGFDTSPSVMIPNGDSETIMVDGDPLLIEGDPALFDHLAICSAGVWSKGKAPAGVVASETLEKVAA